MEQSEGKDEDDAAPPDFFKPEIFDTDPCDARGNEDFDISGVEADPSLNRHSEGDRVGQCEEKRLPEEGFQAGAK